MMFNLSDGAAFKGRANIDLSCAQGGYQRQKEKRTDVSVNDIDGVRVTTPDGWWLVRSSNTEDLLTIRAESFTSDGLERLKRQIDEQLAASDISSPF